MKEWVIKDNYGHYVHKESFCTFREGVSGYTSYHVIANGVYMSYTTKQRALEVLAKLNKDKIQCGFPEMEFHVEEISSKELAREMINFKGKNRIEMERECVA